MQQPSRQSSRWPAFAIPAFRYYWFGRFASVFAVQVTSVAVGWQVYDITRDPLDLGLVGLIQFLPSPLLVLVTTGLYICLQFVGVFLQFGPNFLFDTVDEIYVCGSPKATHHFLQEYSW